MTLAAEDRAAARALVGEETDEVLQVALGAVGASLLCADRMGRVIFATPGLAILLGCDPATLRLGEMVPVGGPGAPSGVAVQALALRGGTAWVFGIAVEIAGLRQQNRALREAIDAEKRLLGELDAARAAAEAASTAKSRFLTAISHELRSPLNAVINFARLMEERIHGELHGEYASYATHIQEAGRHLLRLIEELLELGRAEAGRLELVEYEIDVAHEIGAVCRLLAGEAVARQVSLEHDAAEGLAHVWGDRTRLRQVLFNLLSNALKFTGAGGHVRVSARADPEGGLVVSVADNGIGIAADDLERVMQPFERVAQPRGQAVPGTGLGLPLAQQILELHGGRLELRSAPGEGTVVTVLLPADRLRWPAPD